MLAAFDLSEHLFLMCTLDLPSVRNLGMFIQTLEKLRVSSENISLILNKVEKDVGISVDQITKLFPQGFRSTLPYAKEVSRSINVGQPVLMSFPETEVSKNLVAGMSEFLPAEAKAAMTAITNATKKSSGLFKFFKRQPAPASAGVDR